MRKYGIWFFCLLFAGLALFAYIRSQNMPGHEVRLKVDAVEVTAEQAVDLTLKGVNLSQGKEGEETWTLEAESALYAQDEGVIQLRAPNITYFLPPARETVVVVAKRGEIDQKTNNARLWEEVVITRSGGQIRSEQLFYTGKTHSLNIPGQARFEGPDMFGVGSDVTWNLTTDILTAEKDVDVTFYLQQETQDTLTGAPTDAEHKQNDS